MKAEGLRSYSVGEVFLALGAAADCANVAEDRQNALRPTNLNARSPRSLAEAGKDTIQLLNDLLRCDSLSWRAAREDPTDHDFVCGAVCREQVRKHQLALRRWRCDSFKTCRQRRGAGEGRWRVQVTFSDRVQQMFAARPGALSQQTAGRDLA